MTYFITAAEEDSAKTLAAAIEADSFEEAMEQLRQRAQERWPGRPWRHTSIVEEPVRTPLTLLFDLTRRPAA